VSPYLFINFFHTACFRFGVLGKAELSARLALDTALPQDCALLNGGVCGDAGNPFLAFFEALCLETHALVSLRCFSCKTHCSFTESSVSFCLLSALFSRFQRASLCL
jgi:hypothetical protein